ncbi:MAG: single-stranded-DNA-specific exonuclease RecJ [bacterium]|nr:single-stranded-DNA-specific exonuclease RecJ [bacterium]
MRKWILAKPDTNTVHNLVERTGMSRLLALLLVNRNIVVPESVTEELMPSFDLLHDPFMFPQMDRAVHRVIQAISQKTPILIYGDYDADGLTGTALLYSCLRKYTDRVYYYIPHRIEEGYGLNTTAVEKAKRDNINLIITVDCGITALEEAELAKQLHIDLIITDHHIGIDVLPRATAILHTQAPDTPERYRELAGVGVAYKFAQAISAMVEHRRELAKFELIDALDLVAIGTICDVVSLVGENRLLTKFGIQQLQRTTRPGLRALLAISRLGNKHISASQVAFSLGPRLNAAGRIAHSDTALRLLLSDSPEQANELAHKVDELNRDRRQLESELFTRAEEKILSETDLIRNRAIVLWNESWHQGILGVVAGKIAEKYQRPVALLGFDGVRWSGSVRSIDGFDLISALRCCDSLTNYGGHAKAAGIAVDPANLNLFCEQFYTVANQRMAKLELISPLAIDAEVNLAELSFKFLKEELPRLEPFGMGYPEPTFLVRHATISDEPKLMKEKHLKFRIRSPENISCTGMMYRYVDHEPDSVPITYGETYDIVFTPRLHSYQGTETIELVIKDIRPSQ